MSRELVRRTGAVAGAPLGPGGTVTSSGGELGATVATAVLDDRPTGACGHAGAETVLLRAAAVVGLEGALAHGGAPGSWVGRSRRTARGTARRHRRPPRYGAPDGGSNTRTPTRRVPPKVAVHNALPPPGRPVSVRPAGARSLCRTPPALPSRVLRHLPDAPPSGACHRSARPPDDHAPQAVDEGVDECVGPTMHRHAAPAGRSPLRPEGPA